jgi:nucleoside 2-deoxyribosyltransferase
MFKMYYASAIDVCVKRAFEQIAEFKKIFAKYPIEVYGAGFGDSPIIPPNCSDDYKGVITAYDLRKIRECDILFVVADLETFAAGTCMELEYARQQGLYIILLCPNPDPERLCLWFAAGRKSRGGHKRHAGKAQ